MIITLIIITALLSLLHYTGWIVIVGYLIDLPLDVYLALLSFLIMLRFSIALYKLYPSIRRIFNSLLLVTSKVDILTSRIDKLNSSSPFKNGGKKAYSTSANKGRPLGRGVSDSKESPLLDSVDIASKMAQGVKSHDPLKSKASRGIPENDRFDIYDTLSAVRIKNSDANAMTIVKGGAFWVKLFIRMLTPMKLTVTAARVHAIVIIFRRFSKIGAAQGIKGLVIHLKACSVCLIQALAGHKIHGRSLTTGLNTRISRTNRGIPRIILVNDRHRIYKGDYKIIQFYQSAFNLFRVLDFPGKVKLNTITGPFTGDWKILSEISLFVKPFVSVLNLNKVFGITPRIWGFGYKQIVLPNDNEPAAWLWLKEQYENYTAKWISKASPGTKWDSTIQVSMHPLNMIRGAQAIGSSTLLQAFNKFLVLFPINSNFSKSWRACLDVPKGIFRPIYALGKLSLKEEPAGKVRVFAMVLAWVQLIMKPIHQMVFKILRSIRQDGTFDQLKPLKAFLHCKKAYSLDLSAATDRLPIALQVALLAGVIGSYDIATAWATLLTDLEYSVYSMKYNLNSKLKYSVGQPMGALSSWGMLALTHHFIVQASAWKAGVVPVGTWFKNYVILGDDLVIFDEQVKDQYLKYMKGLGMEFGLHKSILCLKEGVFEFAKKMFYKGHDVSAIPILEFTSALSNVGAYIEFSTKYQMSFLEMAKALGFRYKALAKVGSEQFSKYNYKLKILKVASLLPTTEEKANELMALGGPKTPIKENNLEVILKSFSVLELQRLANSVSILGDKLRSDASIFWNLGDTIKKLLTPMPESSDTRLLNLAWGGNLSRKLTVTREGLVDKPRTSEETTQMIKPALSKINTALACLVDLLVIDQRQEMLEEVNKIVALANSPHVDKTTMVKALVHFISVSKESALITPYINSLKRAVDVPYGRDPISVKLWKTWAPKIQNSVYVERSNMFDKRSTKPRSNNIPQGKLTNNITNSNDTKA